MRCAKAFTDFVGLPHVNLEDVVAAKALDWMRIGDEFADGLHLAKAEECDAFLSFDRDFVKTANLTLLAASRCGRRNRRPLLPLADCLPRP